MAYKDKEDGNRRRREQYDKVHRSKRGHKKKRVGLDLENKKAYHKQYDIDNADKIKQRKKLYYQTNKEKIKTVHDVWYTSNKEDILKRQKDYYNDVKPEHQMFWAATKRAKDRGMEFDLVKSEIRLPELCPLLEIPVYKNPGKLGPNSPTLDRLDNTKGYTKTNVNVVSYRANHIKSDASFGEFEKIYLNWKKLRDMKEVKIVDQVKGDWGE